MGRLAPAIGIIVALVALTFIIGAFSTDQVSKGSSDSDISQFLVTEAVKSVVVQDETGQSVTLDQSLPDRTLVTFWDATCGECQVGLPMIVSFAAAHPEIKPILINVKNTREQAAEAIKKYNLSIETYYDPTGEAQAAWSGTMPATYYIRNGNFRVFFPGRPNAEQLNALLTVN